MEDANTYNRNKLSVLSIKGIVQLPSFGKYQRTPFFSLLLFPLLSLAFASSLDHLTGSLSASISASQLHGGVVGICQVRFTLEFTASK